MTLQSPGISNLQPNGALTVAVIDPNASSRSSTAKLLEENGYKVRFTSMHDMILLSNSTFPKTPQISCSPPQIFSIITLQVKAMQKGSEALALFAQNLAAGLGPSVDVILKAHDPPASNAPRFLQKLGEIESLKTIPIIGKLFFFVLDYYVAFATSLLLHFLPINT